MNPFFSSNGNILAKPWFRLWTDMATDPKWRTISRKAGQSIGNVISVYIHMMTCASNATERGRTQGWVSEDVATALDIDVEQVDAILAAMEGRVIENGLLTGWEKRQPIREDGASSRAKAWRDKQSELARTQPNATERKKTLDKEEIRIDKDKEESKASASPSAAPAKPKRSQKIPLPDGFTVSEAIKIWAKEKQFDQLDRHLESFIDKSKANGYQYVDWDSAFRNAITADWAKVRVIQRGSAIAVGGNLQLGAAGQATALAAKQWLEGKNAGR